MSNEHYDAFAKATIPNLTGLDRQLLGHYCARFNLNANPPKAWPPRKELMRITGATDKAISRSLTRLIKLDFLFRITYPSKERGRKAEFAPNMKLIESYIQVTEELPIIKDVTHLEVTEEFLEGNPSALIGNPSAPFRLPDSYPKPNKPNKPNKRNYESKLKINHKRWSVIIMDLPKDVSKNINPAPNSEILLDKLEHKGTSYKAIRKALDGVNWSKSHKNGGMFISTLETLAGVTSPRESSPVAWCGECDEKTRQFNEPSFINGVETYNCPNCHALAKQLTKERTEPTSELGDLNNFFRGMDE